MLDYHGKQKHCMYLGVINGKMFEKQYDDMAKSEDMLPVASTILPVLAQDEPKFACWIFYDTIPGKKEEQQPVKEEKQPLKLDM